VEVSGVWSVGMTAGEVEIVAVEDVPAVNQLIQTLIRNHKICYSRNVPSTGKCRRVA